MRNLNAKHKQGIRDSAIEKASAKLEREKLHLEIEALRKDC